jgi:hypothetical protein
LHLEYLAILLLQKDLLLLAFPGILEHLELLEVQFHRLTLEHLEVPFHLEYLAILLLQKDLLLLAFPGILEHLELLEVPLVPFRR